METIFQDVVGHLRDAGATVLLSSHILAEAEALCDRVSIIRDGRVVESGTLADLRQLTRTSIRVTAQRPMGSLEHQPGAHDVVLADGGRSARLEVDAPSLGAVVEHLGGYGVLTLTCAPPTLEELFLRHYSDELSDPHHDDELVSVRARFGPEEP